MARYDYKNCRGRISNNALLYLCTKNDWFTCGSNEQCEKLLEMNDQGASIEKIATIIWICSDKKVPSNCLRDIIFALNEAGFTERQEFSEEENLKNLKNWLDI